MICVKNRANTGLLALVLVLTACGGGDSGNSNSIAGTSPRTVEPDSRIFAAKAEIPIGGEPIDFANVECKDSEYKPMVVKPKTITIYNNTEATIYPAIVTSDNKVNEWVQGCLRTRELLPTKFVYKLYVNEGTGIASGKSVEITLPLFSKLSSDQYITWWNGGRVVLGDNDEGFRKAEDVKLATPKAVRCEGAGTVCKLSTYSSAVGFRENVYAQLSEYTFGDSITVPNQDTRLLKPENVGYNISYVDHVYFPVAIGPKNNSYIGYSGSTQDIKTFRDSLGSFLKSGSGIGWPVYNINQLKLPGGYNIFAQRFGTLEPDAKAPARATGVTNPPLLTALKCQEGGCNDDEKKNLQFGAAVQRLQNLFGSCVEWNEDTSKYVTEKVDCPQDLKTNLSAIKQFFAENHRKYLNLHFPGGSCKSVTPKIPVFNYFETLKHVYGWVPFNDDCGAGDNPLSDTNIPGWTHQAIQDMFIDKLQYNHQQPIVKSNPKLTFNPYVKLIHDDLGMNAYAFSVDDAVGFMSELGDGLIFTVGGPKGLENQKQFDYKNGFSVALGVPTEQGRVNKTEPVPAPNTALIKKYGVCVLNQDSSDMACNDVKQGVTMPINSTILGFRVGTVASYPIKLRFTDFKDNVYTFNVGQQFAECTKAAGDTSSCPTNKPGIVNSINITCNVVNSAGKVHPKSKTWCDSANPNQQKDKQLTKNYLSFSQPVDFL